MSFSITIIDIIGNGSLKIVNISTYFSAADGELALIEVYIQVYILMTD